MATSFQHDIQAMYALADQSESLTAFIPALFDMLGRNAASLADVTYAYRLKATDTGYSTAFSLKQGQFSPLSDTDAVDVTVSGKESNLLAIFKRTLNPMSALLLGKVKLNGSKTALVKLASFL